jgi:5-methylcytosine-specific restriction endonuclease McrA/Holliday junction resolvase
MPTIKPPITLTTHTLPFDKLSPRDFERLSLWLVEREGYERAEHLGAAGSEQGRDIVAWREGQLWAFECKRVQRFSPGHALGELEKLLSLPQDERPTGIVFLVTCNVPAKTRQQVRERCAGAMECHFWAGAELDAKIKQHPDIVREFFRVVPKPIVISEKLRERVIKDSRGVCSICGRVGVPLEIRHIVPIESGGTNAYENLQAVCRSCHVLVDKLGIEPDRAREIASSAYRLETLAARILRDAGFAVISGVTGPDAGVDVLAQISDPATGELRTLLVECRGGHGPISSTDVAPFAAKLKQYGADFGVIVSNEDPTFEARDTARDFGISIVSEGQFGEFVQSLQGGDDAQ